MDKNLSSLIFLLLISNSSPLSFFLGQFYDPLPTSFFKCFWNNGLDKIGLCLASPLYEEFNPGLIQNIYNAKSAGLSIELVYIPCRGTRVEDELENIKKNLGSNLIDRIWIFPAIKDDKQECFWPAYPPQQNCRHLQSLINSFRMSKLNVNIATEEEIWEAIFGEKTGCPQVSDTLLWWLPSDDQISDEENFNNYRQIGGWKEPSIKTLDTEKMICGMQFLKNFYQ